MKKEYISPAIDVVEVAAEGQICTSPIAIDLPPEDQYADDWD